jgi:hypothetical protein
MGGHRPGHLSQKGTEPIAPCPPAPQHHEGLSINITSWRIVAALALISVIAAALLFATGLKANADSAPTYDGRTRAAPPHFSPGGAARTN